MLPKELEDVIANPTIENIKFLVKWLFPTLPAAQNITETQAYIIKRVAFQEKQRISISAYTRYGKTQTIAIAVGLYILMNENKRVKFIGPTSEQAGIIRDYMSDLILNSRGNILLSIAEISVHKEQRLKAEASSQRLTFTNGCEYRVVTAHGKGSAAMGYGGDLIIMDEAAMITREAYAKITRMLGDDPENSSLIELFNPWDRDTKAFDHSINSRFERIKIDWRTGIKEGRTTEDYIEEQRQDLDPISFMVLYESEFPKESEHSIHSIDAIEKAEKISFGFEEKLNKLRKDRDNKCIRNKKPIYEELNKYSYIIACDPADEGMDFTVITSGICKNEKFFEITDLYSESKSEPMELVGKLMNRAKKFNNDIPIYIKLDSVGFGKGPISRLKEIIEEENLKNFHVIKCDAGEAPVKNKDDYLNKKAENNFRLKDLMVDGKVSLSKLQDYREYATMKRELLSMKKKKTSNEKWKIEDPEKSPDYNDSLVIFTWKGRIKPQIDFVDL